jgi:hypothetical protein
MEPTAGTPEELETLLEDALLLDDGAAVQALFARGRVHVIGGDGLLDGSRAADLLTQRGFVASPRHVRLSADVAIGAGAAVTVSQRDPDRQWRLLVVVVPGAALA